MMDDRPEKQRSFAARGGAGSKGWEFFSHLLGGNQEGYARVRAMVKVIFLTFVAVGVCGCSGGLRTSPLEADWRFASPLLGLDDDLRVVYPAGDVQEGTGLEGRFGPAWRSLDVPSLAPRQAEAPGEREE